MTALDLPLGGPAWPADVAELIRQVNESNEAVEDQCLRARQATDIAASSQQVASSAEAAARGAKLAYETIQREHPRRRAPLPRQVVLASARQRWTEWPATSRPRRWMAARTPRWCGLGSSWPCWPEARWRSTFTGTASRAPACRSHGARAICHHAGRLAVLVPGHDRGRGWPDPGGGWGGPIHRCDRWISFPRLSRAPHCRDAAGMAGPPGGPRRPAGRQAARRPQRGMQRNGIA